MLAAEPLSIGKLIKSSSAAKLERIGLNSLKR